MSCMKNRPVFSHLGIGIDYFSPTFNQICLSHIHEDHIIGIQKWLSSELEDKNQKTIWCSPVTARLLELYIEYNQITVANRLKIITMKPNKWYSFIMKQKMEQTIKVYISSWPSCHCPGSLMFGFLVQSLDSMISSEWSMEARVVTGDFRAEGLALKGMEWFMKQISLEKNKNKNKIPIPIPIRIWYDSTFEHVSHPENIIIPSLYDSCTQLYHILDEFYHSTTCFDLWIHLPRISVEPWIKYWWTQKKDQKKHPIIQFQSCWPQDHLRTRYLQYLLEPATLYTEITIQNTTSNNIKRIWLGHMKRKEHQQMVYDATYKHKHQNKHQNKHQPIEIWQLFISCTYLFCESKEPKKSQDEKKHTFIQNTCDHNKQINIKHMKLPFCGHASLSEIQHLKQQTDLLLKNKKKQKNNIEWITCRDDTVRDLTCLKNK